MVRALRSKVAFYLSFVALVLACLAIIDLIVGEGVTGWLFTIGTLGSLVCVPLSVILEPTGR
jgi:hypothetical protein